LGVLSSLNVVKRYPPSAADAHVGKIKAKMRNRFFIDRFPRQRFVGGPQTVKRFSA
jgi:hypothetical protein